MKDYTILIGGEWNGRKVPSSVCTKEIKVPSSKMEVSPQGDYVFPMLTYKKNSNGDFVIVD